MIFAPIFTAIRSQKNASNCLSENFLLVDFILRVCNLQAPVRHQTLRQSQGLSWHKCLLLRLDFVTFVWNMNFLIIDICSLL